MPWLKWRRITPGMSGEKRRSVRSGNTPYVISNLQPSKFAPPIQTYLPLQMSVHGVR